MSSNSHSLDQDTIAAIATPSGRGGVSIIRISGPKALSIAKLLTQKTVEARQPLLTRFFAEDHSVIDTGLTLIFRHPASFTGEDVAEFHCHGGVMVTNLLLEACLALGARLARPGEFSERAFLNNKMDLTQAEGLADLIDAPTQQAARQASASLQGAFSDAVNQINQHIIDLRVYVEAAIDFPEEEVDFLSEGRIAASLLELRTALATLITQAKRGALLSRGAQIVMTGAPNAGKSSLMNRLANQAVAIVTDVPGTTRDVIKQSISIEGVAVQLSDTAGIRTATNAIEQEGIERAQTALDTADIIIEVIDDVEPKETGLSSRDNAQSVIRVLNKIDLSGRTPGVLEATDQEDESVLRSVAVSAETGEGIQALEQVIIQCLGMGEAGTTSPFSARERHVTCLKRAEATLDEATDRFEVSQAGELLAEDLRRVHAELSAITGAFGADDLLGEIFSSFCIGK